jgi:hypothetical protein
MSDTTPKDQPPKPTPTDLEKSREDAVRLWEEREREASRISTESLHEALEKLPDAPNRESITPSGTPVPRPANSPYSAADEERDDAEYMERRTTERLKRKAEAPKEK